MNFRNRNTENFNQDNTLPLLEVENLCLSFTQYERGLKQKELKVINGLDISIYAGEIIAVIGSSGSGKSLLAHSILGILPVNSKLSGVIKYRGKQLTIKDQQRLRGKKIALVPQSVNFLDPLIRVGKQVRLSPEGLYPLKKQREIFKRYHLNPDVEKLYPFQLSGGMARRVIIAAAMISNAELIIADEPTPGMHADVIKETMKDFRQIADKGNGLMLITHDICSALDYADKVAVFYAGTTVEIAPVDDFRQGGKSLRHPYSRALWSALPANGFKVLEGFQPLPGSIKDGCLFAPRCYMATGKCFESTPGMRSLKGGKVRCIHAT